MRFIVFDVRVGDIWLPVPEMEAAANHFGLECIPYARIPTTVEALDAERDRPSVIAERRGMGAHPREGIVCRPLFEVTLNDGNRVISKHKIEAKSERSTPQKIASPEKLAVLAEATAIAQEWVTPMRLVHVLQHLGLLENLSIRSMKAIIEAMVEDVLREAAGLIVDSKDARVAIGRRTTELVKARIEGAKK